MGKNENTNAKQHSKMLEYKKIKFIKVKAKQKGWWGNTFSQGNTQNAHEEQTWGAFKAQQTHERQTKWHRI